MFKEDENQLNTEILFTKIKKKKEKERFF